MTAQATAQPESARSRLRRALPASPDLALLVLRLAVGIVVFAHGAQKVFQFGLAGTGESFAGMGVPLGEVAGPAVAVIELVGGAAIVVGAATRVFALLIAATMAVASVLVHGANGIFLADGGFELTMLLGAGAIALALASAGRYSVDAIVARR